ncbi:hypothetical protein [Carboxylicivirga sp. M1479]|uniref:hypothetical protein n=1 Tax=Carboxylicivirga sp. M1479 TaxID=2594476 RepID=UPI0011786073|nr:hypothetical protein [Carboxylicivirga sp. M1479]TRX63317.1 hypothetical protein FNN09_18880 [Carboxylicivirga sp. M1479]
MTKYTILLLFLSGLHQLGYSQENEIDRWDNWLLVGNKVVLGGRSSFKHSHELQMRVNNNMQSLKEWFYEGVFTFSPNQNWELVPDFRASVKPDKMDYRIGLGAIRKFNVIQNEKLKRQFVNQLKYQIDVDGSGTTRHGLRLVLTYNYIVNEKLIVSGLFGPFYRWSEQFTGVEFVRGGPAITYVFNDYNTFAFAPLFGAGNIAPDGWSYSFTPMLSIIIRLNNNYKYLPAKYINF